MLYPKLGHLHFIWPKTPQINSNYWQQWHNRSRRIQISHEIYISNLHPIYSHKFLWNFHITYFIYSPAQIPHQNLKSRHIHGVLSHFGHCLHTDSTEGSRGWSWFPQGISLPPKMMLPEMQYVCKITYTSRFSGLLKQEVHPEYIWRYIPISTVARLVSFCFTSFVLWLPTFSWPWRSMPVRSAPRWHALGPLLPLHLSFFGSIRTIDQCQ